MQARIEMLVPSVEEKDKAPGEKKGVKFAITDADVDPEEDKDSVNSLDFD